MAEPREYRYVCDDSTAGRISRVLFRKTVPWWFWLTMVVLFGVVMVLNRSNPYIYIALPGAAALLGLFLLRQVKTAASKQAAPGTVYASRFDEDAFEMTGPLGSSRTPYATLRSVESRPGDVVVWRQRDSSLTVAAPGEVFPPDEVERVRARIAGD